MDGVGKHLFAVEDIAKQRLDAFHSTFSASIGVLSLIISALGVAVAFRQYMSMKQSSTSNTCIINVYNMCVDIDIITVLAYYTITMVALLILRRIMLREMRDLGRFVRAFTNIHIDGLTWYRLRLERCCTELQRMGCAEADLVCLDKELISRALKSVSKASEYRTTLEDLVEEDIKVGAVFKRLRDKQKRLKDEVAG